jgi:hypothetical protein
LAARNRQDWSLGEQTLDELPWDGDASEGVLRRQNEVDLPPVLTLAIE